LFKIYLSTTELHEDDDDRRNAWDVLPEDMQRQLDILRSDELALDEAEERTERVRLVADLIASMTEKQLLVTHRRLMGYESGSVADLIY